MDVQGKYICTREVHLSMEMPPYVCLSTTRNRYNRYIDNVLSAVTFFVLPILVSIRQWCWCAPGLTFSSCDVL